MRNALRVAGVGVLAAFAALSGRADASAHEHRAVLEGQYEITIGFMEEPAFVGEKNGLYLRVDRVSEVAGSATPAAAVEEGGDDHGAADTGVTGLELTLQAEVIYGDQTMPLVITPGFNQPGVYQSMFFPMAAGDYTYRIFGTIEGNAIDETFTSSPEGFDSVQDREPFEFPKLSA